MFSFGSKVNEICTLIEVHLKEIKSKKLEFPTDYLRFGVNAFTILPFGRNKN